MEGHPISDAVRIIPMTKLIRRGVWATEMIHAKPHDRLLWITRGQGRITVGAKNQGYGAYTSAYIPAGVSHSFEVRSNCFGWAIDVDPHDDLVMPKQPMLLRLTDIADQRHFAKTIEALQTERNLLKGRNVDELTERALRYQAGLLGVWLERAAKKQKVKPSTSPAERLVNRYLEVMEARMGLGNNVAALAEILEVTPTHLTRCCRKTLGRSALEILNERIHYQARVELATTAKPIKQIAYTLGFASAAYFTRAFQNMAEETPSEFRASQSRL